MSHNINMSMSKFYIKNNVVIDHPSDIDKKKNLNEYAIELAKKNQKNDNMNNEVLFKFISLKARLLREKKKEKKRRLLRKWRKRNMKKMTGLLKSNMKLKGKFKSKNIKKIVIGYYMKEISMYFQQLQQKKLWNQR